MLLSLSIPLSFSAIDSQEPARRFSCTDFFIFSSSFSSPSSSFTARLVLHQCRTHLPHHVSHHHCCDHCLLHLSHMYRSVCDKLMGSVSLRGIRGGGGGGVVEGG